MTLEQEKYVLANLHLAAADLGAHVGCSKSKVLAFLKRRDVVKPKVMPKRRAYRR